MASKLARKLKKKFNLSKPSSKVSLFFRHVSDVKIYRSFKIQGSPTYEISTSAVPTYKIGRGICIPFEKSLDPLCVTSKMASSLESDDIVNKKLGTKLLHNV